jgi:hypothetical protein
MNAAREDVCRRSVAGRDVAHEKWLRTLLGLVLAAAFALPGESALAQDNPIMPKLSIGGGQKRPLTPEEQERQKQIDADYKAATCAAGACCLGAESFRVHAKRFSAEEETIGATTAIAVQAASRGCRVIIGALRLIAFGDVVYLSAFADIV